MKRLSKVEARDDPHDGARPDLWISGSPRRRTGHLREIKSGPASAFAEVNLALIETYWAVGQQLSIRVAKADRGRGVVQELAA